MNIADFVTELYCKIGDALPRQTPGPQARLSVSELVTIGVFHAIKNVNQRPYLTRAQFVIARSAAMWRSRSRSRVPRPNEIAALRSQ